MRRYLVLPLTVALALSLATAASATPVPAFTVSENPTVGVAANFDATATICDAPPCGYTWLIVDGSRLGITFSRLPTATYTFSERQVGLIQIELTVVNSNPRIGGPSPREATLSKFITVAPAVSAPVPLAPPPPCSAGSFPVTPGTGSASPDPCSQPSATAPSVVTTPATDLATTVTEPPLSADTSAPSFRIAVGARSLRRALSGGLRVTLATNEPGAARVTMTVDRATARRLRIDRRAKGRVKVGSLKTIVTSGAPVVVVKLTAKARRALNRAEKVKLRIAVLLTDGAGNTSTRTATVTLNR